MLCSRCNKRVAVVFVNKIENGESKQEGLCIKCAKELGIQPINEMMDKMGISEEDLEEMDQQITDMMGGMDLSDFEMGGSKQMPFLQNIFGDVPVVNEDSDETATNTKDKKTKKPKKEKKEQEYKFLTGYCENLTEKAKNGGIDKIVGRDREIYRVLQILNRRTKNNPCLIGEPGVGKTAIAEGIAIKLAEGDVPPRLIDKEIYLLDLTALVAGTQFRGQFESRVKGLVADVKKAGNIILFIDEVHNLVGAGDSSEGSMNAANILKPALSRGEIQVIGATTFTEYRKHIEKDAALERRFQPVKVDEPNISETFEVLKGIKQYYEAYHRVKITDEIAKSATVLSERYITDRFLPDKAIDLLDEACSCATLRNEHLAEYDKLNRQYKKLTDELKQAEEDEQNLDYEKISQLKAEMLQVEPKLKEIEPKALGMEVTYDDIAKVIELWTVI
ncbi:MAG: ATP-dependent Clp protease ATP-binding subunit, partial [Oscillospiraceae bacterium]